MDVSIKNIYTIKGTLALFLLTMLMALIQEVYGVEKLNSIFGVLPNEILSLRILSLDKNHIPALFKLITYLFFHGGLWHVIPNMTAFLLFGMMIEKKVGTSHFIGLYFLFGIIGVYAVAVVNPNTNIPITGASVAISGLVGFFVAYNLKGKIPNFKVLTIAIEFGFLLCLTFYFLTRTINLQPGLKDSIVYHFIPMFSGWLFYRYLFAVLF